MNQKYIRNFVIFILIIFFNSTVFSADDTNIVFKWSFLKKNAKGTIERIDFNNDVTFNKDDQLKITINPIKNAYFYLYYVDNNNDLNILFPDNFDSPYKMDAVYNIPGNKEDWFVFDTQKGVDRFYMLVSYNRLANLEKLSKDYQKLVNNKSNQDKISNAKKNLLDEILSLRANYSKFKVFAEKPTSIAGVSRGIGGESKDTMIYVEADKFYGKIFRINH